MLDELSQKYIEKNFYVYDQNWMFYQNFLGEPFLLEDVILYFDGEILFICAFHLSDINKKINLDLIMNQIGDIISLEEIKMVDIWGVIDHNSKFITNERVIDYSPPIKRMSDCVINIDEFSLKTNRKARLSLNAAHNSGLRCLVQKRNTLSFEHLKLMNKFLKEHKMGATSKQIFLSLPIAVTLDISHIVEVYDSVNVLKGFALLTIPSKEHAVYTLACFDNTTRASDLVMYTCIMYCKKHNISKLHLGYSASEGLLRFKKKWGGILEGPQYEEFFIVINKDINIIKHINNGTFLWNSRMLINEDFKNAEE